MKGINLYSQDGQGRFGDLAEMGLSRRNLKQVPQTLGLSDF